MIKSRRDRRFGHASRMEDIKDAYKILIGNMKRKDYFEGPGVDRKMMVIPKEGGMMCCAA
jgi:hypothetical protein